MAGKCSAVLTHCTVPPTNAVRITAIKRKLKMTKVVVAGTGYVGLSNAVLLAQHHQVTAVDIVQSRVDAINHKQSPIEDKEISDYLVNKPLNLSATTDTSVYQDAEWVIIATP